MINIKMNFDPEEFRKRAMDKIKKLKDDWLMEKAKSIVCPVHNSVPDIHLEYKDADKDKVSITGICCEAYMEIFIKESGIQRP